MHDVQLGITQPPSTFIWNTNVGKLRYDSYLAVGMFIFLSYVVGMDVQLGKHCDFFRLRWDDLEQESERLQINAASAVRKIN